MTTDKEPTIEDERANVFVTRPHLVILGAGASRAGFPNGDRSGKKLPLMSDCVEILALRAALVEWGFDPERNLEDIFTEVFAAGEMARVKFLQQRIGEYFSGLQIGDRPTLYDHLVLSLRKKDFVATFNWDPLLLQAYRRNSRFDLPQLLFLHGNVEVGYCEKDRTAGNLDARCNKCKRPFSPCPLLYPVGRKDYAKNSFIASQWQTFRRVLGHTFMVTIFGYSGPRTDQEALAVMSTAWGAPERRELEQSCFITKQREEEVLSNFSEFIHSHHREIDESFYDSWIARHPRRTGEAWWNQYLEAKFLPDNPIPENVDFPELWSFFRPFIEPERGSEVKSSARPTER